MKEAAETYSIISIGICFMTKENHCSLFQLNVSKPDINLNRETAKFLLDHGFNFDQLYSSSADYSQVRVYPLDIKFSRNSLCNKKRMRSSGAAPS